MRRIVLLFLFFIFIPTVGYGWLGQSATNLKDSNATFSYDTDNEVWESNKGVSIEGTGNYISINDNDALMQTIDDDFVLSSNGDIQTIGTIYERSLIGHWNFTDLNNSSYLDFTATTNGSVSYKTGCLHLADGSSDYVSVADPYDHLDLTGDMSITAWVRINDLTDDGCIVSKGDTALSNRSYMLRYNASQTKFSCAYDGMSYIYSTTTVSPMTWYFVTMTRDGDTVYLYVDGTLEASGTDTDTPPSSSGSPLIIGANSWGLSDSIEGCIDDVRIFDRVITDKEIASIYEERNHTKTHSFQVIFPNPNELQSTQDAWEIVFLDSIQFPHGITVNQVIITVRDTSVVTTVNIEDWDDLAGTTVNTIETMTTANDSNYKYEDNYISYSDISENHYIMADLDSVVHDSLTVKIYYEENLQ